MGIYNGRARGYQLYALALILLAGGGVAIFKGEHNFFARALGSLACVTAVYLVRMANVRSGVGRSTSTAKDAPPREFRRPPRVMLAVGVVLLIAVGFSFHYLYRDALGGYHEVAPVYVCASVGVVCTVVWAYVIAKILG